MTQRYQDVWDALSDTPEEAENMKIRSDLMMAIEEHLSKIEGTQTEKARTIGITQPRLNDLLQGRIDKFRIDALVNIAVRCGLQVSVTTNAA